MLNLEWNIIDNKLQSCMPEGTSIYYCGEITTLFPTLSTCQANDGNMQPKYSDEDYNKGTIMTLLISFPPSKDYLERRVNMCQARDALNGIGYDIREKFGYLIDGAEKWTIRFERNATSRFYAKELTNLLE